MVEIKPLREKRAPTAIHQVATRRDYRPPWFRQQASDASVNPSVPKNTPRRAGLLLPCE